MSISMTTLIDERPGRIDGRIGTLGRDRSIEVGIGTPTRLVATRTASTTEDRRSRVGLNVTLLMTFDNAASSGDYLAGMRGGERCLSRR
jgi:hypothetical protein